jgi:hypothetical protein
MLRELKVYVYARQGQPAVYDTSNKSIRFQVTVNANGSGQDSVTDTSLALFCCNLECIRSAESGSTLRPLPSDCVCRVMLFSALFLLNSVVFTHSLGDQAVSTPIQQLRKAFCLWHIHHSLPLPSLQGHACTAARPF